MARCKINNDIALDILKNLPAEKREQLNKALTRNFILTSSYTLSNGTLTIYKQGFYLVLNGTRCSFSVYVKDNDGTFEYTRKPNENKLNKLYNDDINLNHLGENDFQKIVNGGF